MPLTYKRIIEETGSDEIYNDDWFLKDSVLHDTTKVQPSVIKEYVNQGMATSQDLADEATARQNSDSMLASGIAQQMANLADFYNTTKSYVVGDIVMQESGDLLRCIAPTSGSFDNTKWEQVTVDELFDDLNFNADAISYDNTSSGLEADNVQDAIDETITKLSAVGSASGDIASFSDGSDLSMPKLEVAIQPVQDLHGYDAPWVGGAGKNKLDSAYFSGISQYTVNSDQSVTVTANDTRNWLSVATYPMKAGTYVFSRSGISGACAIRTSLDDYASDFITIISGYTSASFTLSSDCNIKIKLDYNSDSYPITEKIQIEQGSSATTWQPYSNICPISGHTEANVTRCGKNLCKSTIHGYVSNSENKVVIDNDSESAIFYAKKGMTYTISSSANMDKSRLGLVATDNAVNNTPCSEVVDLETNVKTWTATWDGWTVWYVCGNRRTAFDTSAQVELGTTASDFVAYNGQTYTIQFKDGDNPLTVYGGSLDVVSGVLTVDRVSTDLTQNMNGGTIGQAYVFYKELSPTPKVISNAEPANVIAEGYTKIRYNGVTGKVGTVAIRDNNYIYVNTGSQDITPTGKAVYELATPFTVQLSPTVVKSLKGVNNVFADIGDILDAEYIRDLTTIINYILEQLNA